MVKRDRIWLAVLGLLVQAFWAVQLTQPAYMDVYYYATNGARLAEGHGFTEQVIWQFLDRPIEFPTPSHSYWMPLASIMTAAGYLIADNFRAAQLPFMLLTGLLPLFSYALSYQLAGERWQAIVAALLTMAGGYYSAAWNQPETFAPFAWAGGLCLFFLAKSQGGKTAVPWFLAGLVAGLAHLTRADGVLLLLIASAEWAWEIRDWRLKSRKPISNLQSPISYIFPLLLGYLLVMGGWFVRNWWVLGRPLSTAGTQTIFLTTYDDLFAYGRTFDLSHLLAWGWGNILQSRLDGLSLAVQTFVAVCCLIFLTPFVLWAWVKVGRERPFLRPFTWYTLVLFATMSLVFTFPGGRGGLFHSTAAIWPWCMALAPIGISQAVEWVAARLPHWQPERAKRIFSALFVGVAFIFSLAVGLPRTQPNPEGAIYEQFGTMLPETAVVMSGNAPGFYYHTGRTSVSIPNEPPEVLLQAADDYDVTHLVLDMNRPTPLAGLYEGIETNSRIRLLDEVEGYRLYVLQAGP